MKYAVAYMNFFDNNLQLTTVKASNPITALIEGVRELLNAPLDDKWLNAFLDGALDCEDYNARLEEIKEDFFNVDQVVAVTPV